MQDMEAYGYVPLRSRLGEKRNKTAKIAPIITIGEFEKSPV